MQDAETHETVCYQTNSRGLGRGGLMGLDELPFQTRTF